MRRRPGALWLVMGTVLATVAGGVVAVPTAGAAVGTLNLTSICTFSGGPYDGEHLWRVTSTFGADEPYTSRSPHTAAPVPRVSSPGKTWFLGVQSTTIINYTNDSGPQQVTKAANGSTCTDPSATITTPYDGATYPLGQTVPAAFACTGTELVSCVGTVADGADIDTSSVGTHPFEVTATAWDGSVAQASTSYFVATGIPATDGCNNTTTVAALISWYPANPGSMSALKINCSFNNNTGTSKVSASYTVHDQRYAQYHQGAGRHITVASTGVGATSITASPGITGTGMAAWVNRSISGPNIAPRTFVTSISGDVLTLSECLDVRQESPTPEVPCDAAMSGGETVIVENAPGARSVDDGVGAPSSTTITSAKANFTAADIGLSISGEGIPPQTTITATPTATTATISNALSASGLASTGDPVVTIGGARVACNDHSGAFIDPATTPYCVTNTRSVTEATITSATDITSSVAIFDVTDVGLEVSGECGQNTSTTADDNPIPAGTYILSTTVGVATTTGGLPSGDTGCTIIVGEPNGNAPADGDVVLDQQVQLDLKPSLVGGSGECADEQPEGFSIVATWRNPGSFITPLALTNAQPGAMHTAGYPGATPTKALGQIVFDTSAADFAAFVIERKQSSPGPQGVTADYPTGLDPLAPPHYDIVVPFAPTGLAVCTGTATSPGLTFSLGFHATTNTQSTAAAGTGRPGTGQMRNIMGSGFGAPTSGGYTGIAKVTSDVPAAATNHFTPLSAFTRTCFYPAGFPNPANFQCGPG